MIYAYQETKYKALQKEYYAMKEKQVYEMYFKR